MHAVIQYIWYWLTAVNEHSLHSPFIYDLYTKTIKAKFSSEDFNAIENIRQKLVLSEEEIEVSQLGATSKVNNQNIRPVSAIAKKGLSDERFSRLLFGLIRNYDCKNVIELGTSFGINTLYMATKPSVQLTTFEGCPNTASMAAGNFSALGYDNIKIIQGNIDITLTEYISHSSENIDLAFIDANHKHEPTIRYFKLLLAKIHDNSIIIIDDIYWSKEMTKAWEEIKNHPRTTVTVDLFKAGIVFFKPELKKSNYKLMY
ncbi:MAG: SAM-dependent methyltransferase [Bacteroidetes bacterium]|nr:MAG: SAM-dependent methyltransferase [Bacteroidota bacterium]